MVDTLYIAEKPELARAIVAGLGGGRQKDGYYECGNAIVTYCFGHLLELCDPEDYDPKYKMWKLEDLPIVHIPWKYRPAKDKKKQLDIIKTLVAKADVIVHAGDPDDEGQLLVDEVLTYIKNTKPVKRLLINDNNISVVKKALSSLRDNTEFQGLSNKALARSVADQLYGYNMTRAYTLSARARGHQGVLSVGRVQTPILGLVVQRDREHEGHRKSVYFTLSGLFRFDEREVRARYVPADGAPTDAEGRINDETFVKSVAEACKGRASEIEAVKCDEKEDSPPLCYNLLSLQADCHRKFGLKPDQVKDITQRLREKYQLITYNRSDCEYLSDEQHADAPRVLEAVKANATALRGAAGNADPRIKSRVFNSANVSAHHAIIPTEKQEDLSKLPEHERNVYLLIARAYVAQFYPKQRYRTASVRISCEGHSYQAQSRTVLRAGWLALYKNDTDNDLLQGEEVDTADDLSTLLQGDFGLCNDTRWERKETKPPPRYTFGTLLKDLTRTSKYITDPRIKALLLDKDREKKGEHGGIGTPATRDVIVKGLIDRGFLIEHGKYVQSSELGRQFFDLLPDFARTPDMTALWHEQQTAIAKGERTVISFLEELVDGVSAEVARLRNEGIAFEVQGEKCPRCREGVLQRRRGGTGHFWGCSRYPECRSTFPDKRGKVDMSPATKPAASSEHLCALCGKGLIRRPGKKAGTYWWGCSGYPGCRHSYRDKHGKPELTDEAA